MASIATSGHGAEGEDVPNFVAAPRGTTTAHLYLVPWGDSISEKAREILVRVLKEEQFQPRQVWTLDTRSYVSFADETDDDGTADAGVKEAVRAFHFFSKSETHALFGTRPMVCRYSRRIYKQLGVIARPVRASASVAIEGLTLVHDAISVQMESTLMKQIDDLNWNRTLKRRVQHYGFEFDYVCRHIGSSITPPIPPFVQHLVADVLKLPHPLPDQCTLNEYLPGQGISSHVDTHSAFLGPIISLSLNSETVMSFCDCENKSAGKKHLLLPRRSLLIMDGEARYKWQHGIAPRKTDMFPDGRLVDRGRRVSLTLRKVRGPGELCECPYEHACDSKSGVSDLSHIRLKRTIAETEETGD